MAIVLGLGAYELALLAAAALGTAILVSPAGQEATREIAKELTRPRDTTVDVAPPVEECDRPCPPCPPCPAPPPPRTDQVPPSRPHFPCPGDHTHVYRMVSRQNPRTCQCFCNQEEEVICH